MPRGLEILRCRGGPDRGRAC